MFGSNQIVIALLFNISDFQVLVQVQARQGYHEWE